MYLFNFITIFLFFFFFFFFFNDTATTDIYTLSLHDALPIWVLANAELLRVARERVQRAEQQLAVARARVASGAAVQTDSLQLRLELTKARVVRLLQESALRIARLQLGR